MALGHKIIGNILGGKKLRTDKFSRNMPYVTQHTESGPGRDFHETKFTKLSPKEYVKDEEWEGTGKWRDKGKVYDADDTVLAFGKTAKASEQRAKKQWGKRLEWE